MNDKNKFRASSKYFTISIYSIVTTIIIATIVKLIFFWKDSSVVIADFLSTLSPFIIGIIIAFLINPLINWLRLTVFMKWFRVKRKVLVNALSILIAYAIVIFVIILGLIYIIPELIASLTLFVNKIPDWADSIINLINNFAAKHPNMNFKYVISSIGNADDYVNNYMNKLIPALTNTLVVTGVSLVHYIFNFIIAMIVSCYLLIDKKKQSRSIKRVIYAFMPEAKATRLCQIIRHAITIFSNFFDGKMIDSLIIGLLTFLCMLTIGLFHVPGFTNCAILVSIIVCVTNMIPYFGPFLGGIPSALLLCIYSPKSGLIFAILIVIIQQLDGNVIGPKILGDSTGLRPLWVIFAITIGGWLAGIAGMFLGVPCLAVISGLMEEIVDGRLARKNIHMPIIDRDSDGENQSGAKTKPAPPQNKK